MDTQMPDTITYYRNINSLFDLFQTMHILFSQMHYVDNGQWQFCPPAFATFGSHAIFSFFEYTISGKWLNRYYRVWITDYLIIYIDLSSVLGVMRLDIMMDDLCRFIISFRTYKNIE